MKKRLAVVATVLTAMVGVAASNGMAADQIRDRIQEPDQAMLHTYDHVYLHDGTCK